MFPSYEQVMVMQSKKKPQLWQGLRTSDQFLNRTILPEKESSEYKVNRPDKSQKGHTSDLTIIGNTLPGCHY